MTVIQKATPRGNSSSASSRSYRHAGVVAKVRTVHHRLVADGKLGESLLPRVSVSGLERALSDFLAELRQAEAHALHHGGTSSIPQGRFTDRDMVGGRSGTRAEREVEDQKRVKANKLKRDQKRLRRGD